MMNAPRRKQNYGSNDNDNVNVNIDDDASADFNDNSNVLGDYGGIEGNFIGDADADADAKADADADAVSSPELVVMSGNNEKEEGSFHDEEDFDVDVVTNTNNDYDYDYDYDNEDVRVVKDRTVIDARENIIDTENNNNRDGDAEKTSGTYPADCYSFLSLYSPFDHFGFWSFGFMVWSFQIAFLILLVLRVASKEHSTTEDVPNPDEGLLADFIPSNVPKLARATQFFAILSYCFFADESMKDVAAAVETFPKFKKVKPGDKVYRMVFSCVLRFIQGLLACLVVLLLVVSTTDVVDIVLNFTAVNFISAFDNVAFELAQWGKYGPNLQNEADRIENLPVPACMNQKYLHVRYRFTVIPIAFILLSCISIIAIRQDSRNSWITKVLRVQFDSEHILDSFSGCYRISTDIAKLDKRYVYEGDEYNVNEARFGYCKDDRKWYLFKGNITSACETQELDKLAYSDSTYDFDISVTFEESWYSRTGTPLEIFFFEDEDSLDAEQCSSFLGDGVCNKDFNIPSYSFDEGDCCAATCDESQCGVGTMKKAFDTDINGDGYPTCEDPSQRAMTIRLNSVYLADNIRGFGPPEQDQDQDGDIFDDLEPRDPLLILDCDGSNVLAVNVRPVMENQTVTVFVSDGAECSMLIKNRTSGGRDIYYVDYTVYHGDKASIDNNPIVIMDAVDSYEDGLVYFQRTPDCYFTKLSNYINITTIYTASSSQNEAVNWLLEDSSGYSSCEDAYFVERYSLAVINFAAPINMTLSEPAYNEMSSKKIISNSLWIQNGRQCAWANVACKDGSVIELDVGGVGLGDIISGTVATEIGLLKNLTRIDMSEASLFGSIPSEIGLWTSIEYINFGSNFLTGTLPSEIGMMKLKWFLADQNLLSGKIPNEIGQLTNLEGFFVYDNNLTGTVSSELGKATALEYLIISGNPLEGPIPSELGQLQELIYLGMDNDGLTGTIPSTLELLNNVTYLELHNNALTGNVSEGILQNKPYVNFNVYGNQLSKLFTVVGWAICTGISDSTGEEGDHYCNCGSDCLADYGQRCQCDEAQSCCDAYIEQNKITNCILCEEGFTNPSFVVAAWDYTSCADSASNVYDKLDEFGTERQCNVASMEAYRRGCFCPSFIPPGKPPKPIEEILEEQPKPPDELLDELPDDIPADGDIPGDIPEPEKPEKPTNLIPQENRTSTGPLTQEEDDMQI